MGFRLGEMQGFWYNGRQKQLIDVKDCGCEEHLEVLLKYPSYVLFQVRSGGKGTKIEVCKGG